jgi:hypothetical protein
MPFGKGTCFVVMGFGKRTDLETGRTLDMDKSYRYLIQPAVTAAGLQCVRADEIVHSGLIDVPMYEALLHAEFVVADLSTSNKNALYELGVRHALRPSGTIVIAEDGMRTLPFDINFVPVLRYRHQGEGIDFDEVERFRAVLTAALLSARADVPGKGADSPVYTFLAGLNPPDLQTPVAPASAAPEGASAGRPTYSAVMAEADKAIAEGDFSTAKALLRALESPAPGGTGEIDAELVRRLAFATYKSQQPSELDALNEARGILARLTPQTSTDAETVRMSGRIHRQLWKLTGEQALLDDAVQALKRAFYLRNDHENGSEYAFLLNTRAARSTRAADAVADFVLARRTREQVLTICSRWLQANPRPVAGKASEQAMRQDAEYRYWVLAAIAEAKIGLERPDAAADLDAAYAAALAPWQADSTRQRIGELQALVAASPLKRLRVA